MNIYIDTNADVNVNVNVSINIDFIAQVIDYVDLNFHADADYFFMINEVTSIILLVSLDPFFKIYILLQKNLYIIMITSKATQQ